MACIFGNFVSVPIHLGFDDKNVQHIVEHGEIVCVFVCQSQVGRFGRLLAQSGGSKFLKAFVLMDCKVEVLSGEFRSLCQNLKISIYSMAEVETLVKM